MHRGEKLTACAVDRVSSERIPEELEGRAQAVEGFISGRIARRGIFFAPYTHARELLALLGVRDRAVGGGRRFGDQ